MCRRIARIAVALLAALAITVGGVGASSAGAASSFTPKALDYLHACQNSDGGFAEKGSASSDGLTAWAMCAIAASGEDCSAWKVGSKSPVDFLSHQSAKWKTTQDYSRTTLAVVAAGKDPRSFGGVNLVEHLTADTRDHGADGDQLGPYVNSHIWAMIALKAAGQTPTARETTWLVGQQNADGGWGWAPGIASDTNDTAAAMEALAAAGQGASSSAMTKAVAYLRARQLSDGGFAYSAGAKSDANSTSWIAQGLLAAGQSMSGWRKSGTDPVAWLVKQQAANGSEKYSATASNNALLVTVEAVPAVCGKAFPVAKAKPVVAVAAWRPTAAPVWPANGATVSWSTASTLQLKVADGTGVGVAASGVAVRVDGTVRKVSLSGGVATVKLSTPNAGSHTVKVTVTDRAGNSSAAQQWSFTVASAAAVAAAAAAGVTPMGAALASGVSSGGVAATAALAGAAVATPAASSRAATLALRGDGSGGPGQAQLIGAVAAVGGTVAALVLAGAIAITSWRRRRGA